MMPHISADACEETRQHPLLLAERLSKSFSFGGVLERMAGRAGLVHAVQDVDLTLDRGETLGVVGESGCGKSTLGRTLLRLYEPTEGSITYDGQDISRSPESSLRPLRRRMQLIFQDPRGSLNPRQDVTELLRRALAVHRKKDGETGDRIASSLRSAGLDPGRFGHRYPSELSGGEAQRVAIARALLLEPELVVADEPVSSLDVTVQAQIVNLLIRLRSSRNLSMLFISHDMAVVRHISDRVMVMYLGRVMEVGSAREIFAEPLHPYTQALMAAAPRPGRAPVGLTGQVPSPTNPPPGCPFQTRCPRKIGTICETVRPVPTDLPSGRRVACHLFVEPEDDAA